MTLFTFNHQAATVAGDNMLHNRKAEPRPSNDTIAALIDAIKPLTETRQMLAETDAELKQQKSGAACSTAKAS